MNLQLLLHLYVISHFGLVLLKLLLVFHRGEIDRHDCALRHLVGIFLRNIAFGGINLLHPLKVPLFMNI